MNDEGPAFNYVAEFSDKIKDNVKWVHEEKTELAENDAIISLNAIEDLEFDIDGTIRSYNEIMGVQKRSIIFDTEFSKFLNDNDLNKYTTNYYTLLDYYNAFDLDTYMLNQEVEPWSGYSEYNELKGLTNDDKIKIDTLFIAN